MPSILVFAAVFFGQGTLRFLIIVFPEVVKGTFRFVVLIIGDSIVFSNAGHPPETIGELQAVTDYKER